MIFGITLTQFTQIVSTLGILPFVIWYMLKTSNDRELSARKREEYLININREDRKEFMKKLDEQGKSISKISTILETILARLGSVEMCISREDKTK